MLHKDINITFASLIYISCKLLRAYYKKNMLMGENALITAVLYIYLYWSYDHPYA